MSPKKIAVLGAGSWGTALAKLVADKGIETTLWARRAELAESIEKTRENREYLSGAALPPNLHATHELDIALKDAEMLIVVVPTVGLRETLRAAAPLIPEGIPIVSATKGIEQGSLKLVSEIFQDELPRERHRWLAFLGGPSFAKEVAQRIPTAVCVASEDEETAKYVQNTLWTDRFRVYRTEDVIGVELGGALKNVIAIAAGVADGMGLGHNTRAGLITRGLAEITRLAIARGGHPLTLSGLAGMGDLVLTCTGDLSRNRQVGMKLGQGMKLAEILEGMNMVAEGVRTSKSAYELALREDVDLPITREVYMMLYHDKSTEEVLESLMMRPLRAERE